MRPTRAQERTLFAWLALTRELYNGALQERRASWRQLGRGIGYYEQTHELAEVRTVRPEFGSVPVVVQRGALRRLHKAFGAFFRRCKSGEKPGYPRFKGRRRWNSLLIDDLGGKVPLVAGGKRVAIPLLGKVKVHLHRPLEGKPKALRIVHDIGRWYAVFACEDVPLKALPASNREVGVDLGLTHFAATSDGELFENPRPLAHARLRLERASRRVSRRKRGSGRRRAAGQLLARAHGRVAHVRREHHIQLARRLVADYGRICVEALNVKGLASGMLAKSVNDAGWADFLHWLRVKAEEAGREVVEVDPRGTSQTCPACWTPAPKPLSQRVHRCDCGCALDRDVAAAQVILRLGTSRRGVAPTEGRLGSAKSELLVANRSTTEAIGGERCRTVPAYVRARDAHVGPYRVWQTTFTYPRRKP